ncbi:MAG: hypothetical protein HYX78_13365 [Armatimonadetes bacterium]|nr:hypothetical protein [Armatimonadota bacterium]
MLIRLMFLLVALAACPVRAQLRSPVPHSSPGATHGSVEAGWYASSDIYKYLVDLNVSFNFGSWGDAKFNMGGGILTLVKDTSRDSFQPDRYRGTIEPAVYLKQGANVYLFSIRHQSFHTIDRPPPLDESYELYNLAYQRIGDPNILLSVGRYLNRDDVDYEWDLFAQVDTACIGMCRYGPIYVSGTGHYVDEDESLSERSSFFDYSLEIGVQTHTGVRYFAAVRQIHDIDQFGGITDDQVVLGVKYLW